MQRNTRGATRRLLIAVFVLVAAALWLRSEARPGAGQSASSLPVYADSLAPGWVAASGWSALDLAATGERYSGSRAIAASFGGGASYLTLRPDKAVAASSASRIRFALYASSESNALELAVNGGPAYRLPLAPGAWLLIDLPLSALGSPGEVASLTWRKAGNRGPQPIFYLDDITLLGVDGAPPATATAAPTGAPTLLPTSEPISNAPGAPPATATPAPTLAPSATPTTAPIVWPTATATSAPPTATATNPPATATAPPAATATAAPPTATAPPPASSDNRITWLGKPWYAHGVNVPWVNWAQDFGGSQYGLAGQILNGDGSMNTNSPIVQRFAQLPPAGVHAVTWWLFSGTGSNNPSGPEQILRDGSGRPTGLNPDVYRDLDAALLLAEQYDLYYTFPVLIRPNQVPTSWLTTYRADLINALRPLFQRYDGHPRIVAWAAFVEPEWAIWNEGFPKQVAQDYVRDFAAAVHAESSQLATLNSAMLDGLPMWTGLGLDFYSASWYDYMNNLSNSYDGDGGNWCALCTTYDEVRSRYNLDKPLVLGEFYAGASADFWLGGSNLGPLGRLNAWYDKGFAGAYAWSLFPEKTDDKLAVEWSSYTTFAATHDDEGPQQ
jgi:hypothetical protein